MTRYFSNFETPDIGSNPSGFTRRGDASTNPSGNLIALEYGTPVFKRRQVKLTSVANGSSTAFSVDGLNSLSADVDLIWAFKYRSGSVPEGIFFLSRGVGTSTISECYGVEIAPGLNLTANFKRVGGTRTYLTIPAFTFAADTWYLIRFQVLGTTVRHNIWNPLTTEEPTAWLASDTDSDVPGAGWQGVGVDDAAGSSIADFNFVSGGLAGDTAFIPILNAEFLEWLAQQDAARCVIAEMQANGYEPGLGSPPGGIGSPPTFLQTIKAYVSNIGYTSQAWDDPPNQHYPAIMCKVPTIRRSLPESLVGGASISFGDMGISNPREVGESNDTPGVRDDWLRVRWIREDFKLYLGDPDWEKDSFRLMMWGRIGQPTAPSRDLIQFRISDIMDALNVPLTTTRIAAGGNFDNQFEPVLLGGVAYMEPPEISEDVYQVDGGAIAYDTGTVGNILDAFFTSSTSGNISAVSGNTMTCASHGLFADWRVRFESGTPPAPLALSTDYWVVSAGLTSNDFRLSATRGGTEITLTDTSTGASFTGYNATFDLTNGTFELGTAATGRVLGIFLHKDNGESGAEAKIPNIYEDIFFRLAGISANRKLTESFTSLRTAMDANSLRGGLWYDTQAHQCKEAADDLARLSNTFFGSTADGLLYVGRHGLPTTAVLTLDEGHIADGSISLESVLLPINFEDVEFSAQPLFLVQGPGQGDISPLFYQLKSFLAAYDYGAASTPIDNYPDQMEAQAKRKMDTMFRQGAANERARLVEVWKKKSGIFKVEAYLRSIYRDDGTPIQLGDTISLSCARLGWKQWTASDPASPDNLTTVDSRLAIVVGIDFTPAQGGAFPVTLRLWRPMPGYYAEANLN